ncbi:hypothetical protein [Lederbergia graminis]|uniref:Nuclear transport factor 2 family protein n=1 Tax=Lederbergia graminis TaxID=735518 RepID=A0ABW0LLF6_9BACI|nr:hypothetical protein [Paenibacillus bovis]HLU22033.1 hypothetical protein [Bacillaceae bacterium]
MGKKLLSVFIIVIGLIMLTACGQDDRYEEKDPEKLEEYKEIARGMIHHFNNIYTAESEEEFEDAFSIFQNPERRIDDGKKIGLYNPGLYKDAEVTISDEKITSSNTKEGTFSYTARVKTVAEKADGGESMEATEIWMMYCKKIDGEYKVTSFNIEALK